MSDATLSPVKAAIDAYAKASLAYNQVLLAAKFEWTPAVQAENAKVDAALDALKAAIDALPPAPTKESPR